MRLAEIFLGFDGEVNLYGQGTPSVFIRFAGCNLRCNYCDTKQWNSIQSGDYVSILGVIDRVNNLEKVYLKDAKFKKVTITGGEPFLQYAALEQLVSMLDESEWYITVETNGSFPVSIPDRKVDCFIVDYKLLESGMADQMLNPWQYARRLSSHDIVKFVIQSKNEFCSAVEIQKILQNANCKAKFAYSPCWGKFDVDVLANELSKQSGEILGNCIINYQLHKLWLDPSPGILDEKIKNI